MNIGITIYLTPGANIWSSGINQNIAFLAMALRKMAGVDQVYLVNGGEVDELSTDLHFEHVPATLIRPEQAMHQLDALVVMGSGLPIEWTRRFKALGKKLIAFGVGHGYVGPAETAIFDRKGGAPFDDMPLDEMWLLPQYMHSCAALFKTIKRVPVFAMPHIWSPHFLDIDLAMRDPSDRNFGFTPDSQKPWRVAIMEPNISVAKNCLVPMLICEHAYRTQPQAIDTMMVLNTFHMKEHPTFNSFARHLDLTRDSKASYEPRMKFLDCMISNRMDAIVSHQWENGQNYVYYEALHGGYPLVHNSTYLRDAGVGFYYPEFEAMTGSRVLLKARNEQVAYWADYKRRSAQYLQSVSPFAQENLQAFRSRLFPEGQA